MLFRPLMTAAHTLKVISIPRTIIKPVDWSLLLLVPHPPRQLMDPHGLLKGDLLLLLLFFIQLVTNCTFFLSPSFATTLLLFFVQFLRLSLISRFLRSSVLNSMLLLLPMVLMLMLVVYLVRQSIWTFCRLKTK